MDFALSEEQEMFQQSARKFLESKGLTEVARRFMDGDENVVEEMWSGLSNLGYTSINIPEEYGGLEQGPISLIPIFEELGRALTPGVFPETISFSIPVLLKYGTAEQKKEYLSNIAEGKCTITLALLEQDGACIPEHIQMKAKRIEGGYVLNGVKTIVPHGDHVDWFIVPARTVEGKDLKGISLFLVNSQQPEIRSKKLRNIDETRKLVELHFDDLKVSFHNLIGSEDAGWPILQDGLNHLNVALCSMMVGGMERCVDMSVEYGNTRVQFGQPIGRFQGVKHRIVNMKLDLERARSLTYYAAWTLENHTPNMEAAIASARAFITEAFNRVAGDNIQNHGGMGYTWEYDCHLYLKRARSWENYLGSPEEYREKTAVALGW